MNDAFVKPKPKIMYRVTTGSPSSVCERPCYPHLTTCYRYLITKYSNIVSRTVLRDCMENIPVAHKCTK